MKTINKINFAQTVIILLCTALVIMTNYIFTKNSEQNVYNRIMEGEYKKIWGKENYTLLRELQKTEMLEYIDALKQEQPELIYHLRQKSVANEKNSANFLSWEAMNELVFNNQESSTWTKITVLEFSDFECPYCTEYHMSQNLKNAIKPYESQIHYAFKNFPLPSHPQAFKLSIAAKCIEKLAGAEKYSSFIENIFSSSLENNVQLDQDMIQNSMSKMEINTEDFEACTQSEEAKILVNQEFEQARKLNIKVTPSSIIINNATWEFTILEGYVDQEEIETILAEYITK